MNGIHTRESRHGISMKGEKVKMPSDTSLWLEIKKQGVLVLVLPAVLSSRAYLCETSKAVHLNIYTCLSSGSVVKRWYINS